MTYFKGFTAEEQDSKSFTTFAVPFRSRGKIQGVHFLDDETFAVLSVSALRYTPESGAEMKIYSRIPSLTTVCDVLMPTIIQQPLLLELQ